MPNSVSVYRMAAITDWYISPDASFVTCSFVNTDGVGLHVQASAQASRRFMGGLNSMMPQLIAWAEKHPDEVKNYQPPKIVREILQPIMMSGSPQVYWDEACSEIVAKAERTNMHPFVMRGPAPMVLSVWDKLVQMERTFAALFEQGDASVVQIVPDRR